MDNLYRNPKLVLYNSVYLFVRMLFIFIIGFYTTRLALQLLGDEDFGINNIVAGITSMFAILSIPIVTTQQRFFNVELSQKRLPEYVIFSTAVRISLMLALGLFVLFETVGLYVINNIIVVPVDRLDVVNIIFQITAVTNIISLMYIPFQAFLYAKEKMGICAAVEVLMAILKLLFLFVIPLIQTDRLILYCGIFLVINSISFCIYRWYFKRHFREIRYKSGGDTGLFKEMWNFSGWNLVESASGIFLTYGSNILINIFGGVLYNTAYGISKQLSDAVNNFTLNILRATEPQITHSHVVNDLTYRNRLLRLSVKSSLLITGLIAIVYINEGVAFLSIWLVNVPAHTFEFSVLAILTCVFTSMKLPIRSLVMASGKIRFFFLAYGLLSVLVILLGYVLLSLNQSILSIMTLLLIHSAIFVVVSIYCLWKEIAFPVLLLIKDVFLSISLLIGTFIIYNSIKQLDIFVPIVGSIIAFFISVLFLSVSVYLLLLCDSEREIVKKVCRALFNK